MNKLLLILAVLIVSTVSPVLCQTEAKAPERLEEWRGRTVLVFTPHPDDDLFGAGGTLALLARNGNRIYIVIYTNDNKGSFDLEMTSERLARIRKAEEESAMGLLGIPRENIFWMGYEDGELEYAEPKMLCGRAARYIRQFRPDVVFSIDPGEWYDRWHKTDHRMAAFNTADAIRAAEFHLYYPEHLLVDGLKPWRVPLMMFYYAEGEANYLVDITEVIDLKAQAVSRHVSQFEPSITRYRPDWDPQVLKTFLEGVKSRATRREGRYVEGFRRATGFNPR